MMKFSGSMTYMANKSIPRIFIALERRFEGGWNYVRAAVVERRRGFTIRRYLKFRHGPSVKTIFLGAIGLRGK